MKVLFHDLTSLPKLTYSVIVSKDKNGFVFVKHNDRDTWEIPGGHIEINETPLETAKRELKEETGAIEFTIVEVCNYSVRINDSETFGRLFYADIISFSKNLNHEIGSVKSFAHLPENLTYPTIQPLLFKEVLKRIKIFESKST